MSKNRSSRKQPSRHLPCEGIEFAQVEFSPPVRSRLVVRFSEGLSLLVEDESAVDLAAEFIVAFRAAENRIHDDRVYDRGGRR